MAWVRISPLPNLFLLLILFIEYILFKMLARHRENDYDMLVFFYKNGSFSNLNKESFLIAVNLLPLRSLRTFISGSEMGLYGKFLQRETNVPLTHL